MRKKLLVLISVLFTGIIGMVAQDIPNSGFKDWSAIQYYEEPAAYSTTNVITFFSSGEANVTKTTDAFSGSFALHLETIDSEEGIVPGAAYIGEISEAAIIGGLPFSERPDAVSGYVKYNTSSFDTAYIAIIFKRIGLPLGICWARFNGTQNTYQQFSEPVEWKLPFINPDTIAIALISSSLFTAPEEGNTLTIDQLSFEGASTPFPEGDFENWVSTESEEANEWFSSNLFTLGGSGLSVTKSDDSHEGNFAVKLENKITIFGDTLGFITNGIIGDDGPAGGMPVALIPDKLSGYYKYAPNGPDTALAALTITHFNENTGLTEILEESLIKLTEANNYTYFEVPIQYYELPEPDTVNVSFASGNIDDDFSYVGLGSSLSIDALEISYKPNIVSVNESSREQQHRVYPNPASDILFFSFSKTVDKTANLFIYNAQGEKCLETTISLSGVHPVEINNLESGIYFYILKSSQGETKGKFIAE